MEKAEAQAQPRSPFNADLASTTINEVKAKIKELKIQAREIAQMTQAFLMFVGTMNHLKTNNKLNEDLLKEGFAQYKKLVPKTGNIPFNKYIASLFDGYIQTLIKLGGRLAPFNREDAPTKTQTSILWMNAQIQALQQHFQDSKKSIEELNKRAIALVSPAIF